MSSLAFDTSKNALHLEKCATLKKARLTRKMLQTRKNAPHLGKCVTLAKMRHTWQDASHLPN